MGVIVIDGLVLLLCGGGIMGLGNERGLWFVLVGEEMMEVMG